MVSTPPLHRKNIRLPASSYRGRRIYFVTLCFDNHRRFNANPRVARWLIQQLQKHGTACEFFVHAYSVTPDHMHALAASSTEDSSLIKLVESSPWKPAALKSAALH